jgi:hypothetical protein
VKISKYNIDETDEMLLLITLGEELQEGAG